MVAIIKSGYAIHRILNYNENKVNKGLAECIAEGNYPLDVEKLPYAFKLNRFLKQLELNRNVTRNSVHISLNFTPLDRDLSAGKLIQIAERFMQKIGFGKQPYLLYQHHDAGHPHLHIVTINVRRDGSSIRLPTNLYLRPCRELEKEFNLVVAEKEKFNQYQNHVPALMNKISYGELPTKKAISQILSGVLHQYAYTNLAELNAVLGQYNVFADRGKKGSRIFRTGGLVYRIVNDQGESIGIGIKASSFHNGATLKLLKRQFQKNAWTRMPFKSRITNIIDQFFLQKPTSLTLLIQQLAKQGIQLVYQRSPTGETDRIVYVDHKTLCIFQGSALGAPYGATSLHERCSSNGLHLTTSSPYSLPAKRKNQLPFPTGPLKADDSLLPLRRFSLLDALTQVERAGSERSFEFKKKQKKRKRKARDIHS